jgi:hypothetical protein
MFKKKFGTEVFLDSESVDPTNFPKYTKFVEDNFTKTVIDEFESDDVEWRRIANGQGADEVIELKALKKLLDEKIVTGVHYAPPKIDNL